MTPSLKYYPFFDEAKLPATVHGNIEDQVWLWANIRHAYDAANNSATLQEDMDGLCTIILDGFHMRLVAARNRRRRHLQREAIERHILLGGGTPLITDETIVIDVNEEQHQSPGDSWCAAYTEEQYPMDIPLEAGGRGPAKYLRFALDPNEKPVMLGSEGYGCPIYSQGLYAHEQPIALHQERDEDLQIHNTQFTSRHEVDKALVLLADPGVCADVLHYHQAITQKHELLGHILLDREPPLRRPPPPRLDNIPTLLLPRPPRCHAQHLTPYPVPPCPGITTMPSHLASTLEKKPDDEDTINWDKYTREEK
ncbi:hypothetical protein EDB83DRAFT_2322542 [Lactarius deliciosus]|nr:hypothetical protein EDB83DRAFT_2322542 [Lactarius deliciosus]